MIYCFPDVPQSHQPTLGGANAKKHPPSTRKSGDLRKDLTESESERFPKRQSMSRALISMIAALAGCHRESNG
jgi:hypothetical protein